MAWARPRARRADNSSTWAPEFLAVGVEEAHIFFGPVADDFLVRREAAPTRRPINVPVVTLSCDEA